MPNATQTKSVCYASACMSPTVRESRRLAKKDAQLVLRLPAAMVEAVKAHQTELQKADPFEHVSLAEAARDLIRRGLAASAKKR